MAATSTKKSPVQSTREQLDELDALLQQMLTLPVDPTAPAGEERDEPATPAPAEPTPALPRRVSLRPTPRPQPEPTPPPEEEAPEEWVPLRGNFQPSDQTWGPLAEAMRQQHAPVEQPAIDDEPGVIRETVVIPAPAAPPDDDPADAPTSSVEAMARLEAARRAASPTPPRPEPLATQLVPEPDAATPTRRGVAASVALFPLVAVNALYDGVTYPLGPVGRWLRGDGRCLLTFLGGIFLVATGAILALDWFDWTW